jgi:uncharacterized protein YjbJ (UPF0337 family)
MGENTDTVTGTAMEPTGRATGDDSLKHEGQFDQAKGDVKGAANDAKDSIGDAVDDVRDKLHDKDDRD